MFIDGPCLLRNMNRDGTVQDCAGLEVSLGNHRVGLVGWFCSKDWGGCHDDQRSEKATLGSAPSILSSFVYLELRLALLQVEAAVGGTASWLRA